MYYRIYTTNSKTSYILEKSDYQFNHDRIQPENQPKRGLSLLGTEAYRVAQQRAFSRAKLISFFNPDLDQFITLTYKANVIDLKKVQTDIDYLIKKHNRTQTKKLKYIYVLEKQQRGSIHVHMIANRALKYKKNNNGYKSVEAWSHGFSSVLTIKDVDGNFKPYLYLFKYMSKSQRIGRSFIHTSKNFDKIKILDYADHIDTLIGEEVTHTENATFEIETKQYRIIKEYYRPKKTKS